MKVKYNLYVGWIALLFIAMGTSGCFLWTTRDDGQLLKQDVSQVEERLAKLEAESTEKRESLAKMIERAQIQVTDMEETLSKATRVLARNSADFGAEMEELKTEFMQSRGEAAEISHALEQLRKDLDNNNQKITEFALAAGLDLPVDESKVPAAAADHFKMMNDSMAAGRHGEVRSLARLYLDRYPKARNQDEVQLLVGKTYVAQKRYAKALGALRRFADLYSKSAHMPEVLYEMANAFYMLGDCTDARILVDTVLSRYKSSPFASKATALRKKMDSPSARCSS